MKTILLVEDDEKIARMLARRLKRAGFETLMAENGKKGVEMATAHEPDLILMDMHMPVMDGHEATSYLRKGGYKGLICALTASVSSMDSGKAFKSGCDHFIAKPVAPDFELTVKSILEGDTHG